MPFTNTTATAYGLLAMYAMDMYRVQQDPLRSSRPESLIPPPAPGLAAAGWKILAYITGKDSLLPESPAKGPLPLLDQTVYYGYLAARAPGEMVAVIRGTDGFVEWVEDAEFLPVVYTPQIALPAGPSAMLVEHGFWTLYASMQLISPEGAPLGTLAPAVAAAAGTAGMVTIVGHSLGAALATYLTLDLARGGLDRRVSACLFASPQTGNQAFVQLFDQTITDYGLFNYLLDIVPRVPPGPDYSPLPRSTVIEPATAEAKIRFDIGCNHHVICYCAMLNYEETIKATTPVPAGEEDSATCILGPRTGNPSLAEQFVSDLAGIVPV
jgi:triacylglycerol lipase